MIAARGRASNALAAAGGNSQMGGTRSRVKVTTRRLDTLLETFPSPDFVKVDVEGAELLVLEGAARLISEVRPTFYMEIGSGRFDRVRALMVNQDYVVLNSAGREATAPAGSDYFMVPAENQAMIAKVFNHEQDPVQARASQRARARLSGKE